MQTDDTEQRQIATLRDFADGVDLARLERLVADDKQTQIAALERFAVDNPDLARLEGMIEELRSEFDALDFLGLSKSEEVHSNVLAWLLNPRESHLLGDYYLRNFLTQTGENAEGIGIAADLSATEVQREWFNVVEGQEGYLDILLLNHETQFFCAIENKIFSYEHSEQLTRYRKALERDYPDFTKRYVFLSPNGVRPYLEEEQKSWIPTNYATVLNLVDQAIESSANSVREDVRAFLKQYSTTLRRKIVPDSNTNIQQLAREIYLKNRDVIELIYQNKPNYASEIKQIFKEAIARQANWRLDKEDTNWVRFRPSCWADSEVMETGTDWLPQSKALILCQFYCTANNAHFYLTLGPGSDRRIREKIIASVNQNPSVFNRTGPTLIDGWMTFHRQEHILDDSDLNDWDDCGAVGPAKLRAWVTNFAENQFPAMNGVIVNCLREYEAEQAQ